MFFIIAGLLGLALTMYFSKISQASILSPFYLFFESMEVETSNIGVIGVLTPQRNFDAGGEIQVTFLGSSLGDWCKTNALPLTIVGVSESEVGGIDQALPGLTLVATCYQNANGDYIKITGLDALTGGISYGFQIGANSAFSTGPEIGRNDILLKITKDSTQESKMFPIYLISNSTVNIRAQVSDADSVVCTISTNTVSLGALYRGGAYVTASHKIGTSTTDNSKGYYWTVFGTGDGSTGAGLYTPGYLIQSLGITVDLLTGEGFGLVVTPSPSATVPGKFQLSTLGLFGSVKRGFDNAQVIMYRESAQPSHEEATVTFGARASTSALVGSYQEILTYSCGGYIGGYRPLELVVTPQFLDFGKTEEVKTFAISNSGSGTLEWNINEPEYTGTGGWITNIEPIAGKTRTSTDNVAVTVNRQNLNSGIYSATIAIQALGSAPKSVLVNIERQIDLPILTTLTPYDIQTNTAKSGGVITDSGGGTIISKGLCYDTVTSPVNCVQELTGDETFHSTMTALTPGTLYYVRAYAQNTLGISYGNEHTFITKSNFIVTPESRDWGNTDVNVTIEVAGNAIEEIQYCWTTESSCSPDIYVAGSYAGTSRQEMGVWNLCYRYKDAFGAKSNIECSGEYRIDKQAPELSASNASDTWYYTPRTAVVYANDAHSGLAGVRYSWVENDLDANCQSGGTFLDYPTETELHPLPEGQTLYLCARDNVGNVSFWSGKYNYYKGNQLAPPAPTLNSVTDDSIVLDSITNGEYRVDEGPWQESPVFAGLGSGLIYTFEQRYKETLYKYASPPSPSADFMTNTFLLGYAWSDNIGWISFSCANDDSCGTTEYRVRLDNGRLVGYAWSEHSGWLRFDPPPDFTTGQYPEGPQHSVKIDRDGIVCGRDGRVCGWARFCGGTVNDDCTSATRAEWSGWVKFGPISGEYAEFNKIDGKLSGWAWGSNNVGWISLNCTNNNSCAINNYSAEYVMGKKTPHWGPGAPTLNTRTDASITLNTISNGQYRIDGGSWQDSPVFTGLQLETLYTFEQRYKETSTHYASQPGPSAEFSTAGMPELVGYAWSEQAGWISFNCLNNNCANSNYRIKILGSSLVGYAWSENLGWLKFDAPPDFTTGQYPSAPQHSARFDTDGTVCGQAGRVCGWARFCSATVNGDCASATDNEWDGWVKLGPVIGNYVTYDAVTQQFFGYGHLTDPRTPGTISFNCADENICNTSLYWVGYIFGQKTAPNLSPGAPTLNTRTPYSITLNTLFNGQYRINGGSWQDSPEFTGLQPETLYTFEQRYKETFTHLASNPSSSSEFSTARIIKLTGYAWSEQAGWISFNCLNNNCTNSNYRVEIWDSSLVGYAWSENLGWLRFDAPPDFTTGQYPEGPQHSAKLDTDGTVCGQAGRVCGWARFCSATVNGDCASATDNEWDGWVKLGPVIGNYVTYNSLSKEFFGYGHLTDPRTPGTISFNCADENICATSLYKVFVLE